jgi:hypothetical protein
MVSAEFTGRAAYVLGSLRALLPIVPPPIVADREFQRLDWIVIADSTSSLISLADFGLCNRSVVGKARDLEYAMCGENLEVGLCREIGMPN